MSQTQLSTGRGISPSIFKSALRGKRKEGTDPVINSRQSISKKPLQQIAEPLQLIEQTIEQIRAHREIADPVLEHLSMLERGNQSSGTWVFAQNSDDLDQSANENEDSQLPKSRGQAVKEGGFSKRGIPNRGLYEAPRNGQEKRKREG